MRQAGLQNVLKDLEEPRPERQLKITEDKNLKKTLDWLLNYYKKTVFSGQWWGEGLFGGTDLYTDSLVKEVINKTRKLRVTPQTISEFLCAVAAEPDLYSTEHEEEYLRNNFGPFVSGLVMRAYEQGHSRFDLPFGALKHPVYNFSNISGTRDRQIEIIARGLAGGLCDVSYINAIVYGDFGMYGGFCAYSAKNSMFTFYGRVGSFTGGYGTGITGCTFKSPYKKDLAQIQKNLVHRKGNKFILLKNGKEELVAET